MPLALSILLVPRGGEAGKPSPAPSVPDGAVDRVDYNDPDPERGALSHVRAFANVALSSYAIWKLAWASGKEWAPMTRETLRANLTGGFVFDEDELQTNFFGHPYHGGLMFNSARGAGLSFWESLPHVFAGSLTWELLAEREPPSANDFVVTTLGGVMLGEITHRLSSELLDDRTSGPERLFRELGAAAVSPMRGLNRAYAGRAYARGPGPRRHPASVALHGGIDRVRAKDVRGEPDARSLTALVAVEVRYGSLLPRRGRTLEPFEFFGLYLAANLLDSDLQGVQVYSNALLVGRSYDLSTGRGPVRDNHVLGLAMTYEFQGANVSNYGSVGLGPADYVTFRFWRGGLLRVGSGLDVVPMIGVRRNDPAIPRTDYNFGVGAAAWVTADLELGGLGELRARTRQTLAAVADGTGGGDYLGATRISYEVDVAEGVGFGVAPRLIQRRSLSRFRREVDVQVETQLFMRLRR